MAVLPSTMLPGLFGMTTPSLGRGAAAGLASSGGRGVLGGVNSFLGSPLGGFAALTGLGAVQGLAQGKRDDKRMEYDAEQAALDRALRGQIAGQELESRERSQAADMAGPSPLAHQGERARLDLLNQFLTGGFRPSVTAPRGIPTGQVNLPTYASPFLSREALANSEVPYHQAARSLNPNLPSPELGQMGYGEAASQADPRIEASRVEDAARSRSRQEALMEALLSDRRRR